MLRQFTLDGFRAFASPTTLRMAPLTVLTGVNSVGKSSVIDVLGAVAQSRQEGSGLQLRLRGTWVDLGSCEQAINWHRSGGERYFGVGWTDDGGVECYAEFIEDSSDSGAALRRSLEVVGHPAAEFNALHEGGGAGALRHPYQAVSGMKTIDCFAEPLLYLGPYRVPPQALYQPRTSALGPPLGSSGGAAAEVLYHRRSEKCDIPLSGSRTPTVEAFVNWWWSRIFATELVARASELGRVGFQLSVDTAGAEGLGLAQVGLGLSQTLPILLLAALSRPGDIVAVQTPEAHLHPGAQHRIGELFVALARHGRQVVIETHSEHLVNSLRLAVRKADLVPDALALHFFEQGPDGETTVTELPVDEQGRLARWPRGFFDQAIDELAQLVP